MAVKVLAWRFDHVGDCNRYGNCVDHPFYERPTIKISIGGELRTNTSKLN